MSVRVLGDLPQHARQVLAELETLLDDDGLGIRGEPEFLRYRRLMLTCDNGDLPALVEQAVRELRSCRRRESPAVDRYDVRAVVLRECAGWSPTDVERSSHKSSARTVRKWRTDDGRNPETGRPLPGRGDTAAEKVAALADQGLPVRSIALRVGLPKSTVHDMLVAQQRARE